MRARVVGRAVLGLLALGGVGCGGAGGGAAAPGTDALSKKLPLCAAYRDIENTWGYCVYKHAGGFPTKEDVELLCPSAGEWEDQCRHAWVAGRMQRGSGFERSDLLDVCGENADCSFELIDFRYEDLLDDQIALCKAHAGRHGEDCVGHAVQRWWMTKPDAAEVARVAALNVGYPRKVGFFIGASVFCAGVGTCEGHPDTQAICETQVELFGKRPETCPPQQWHVMPHNQGRGAPKGPGPAQTGSQPAGPSGGGGAPQPTGGEGPANPPSTPQTATSGAGPTPPAQQGSRTRHQPGTIPPPR